MVDQGQKGIAGEEKNICKNQRGVSLMGSGSNTAKLGAES